MALCQVSLVLHVCANALDGSKVAEVAVLGESRGKSTLRAVKKLRVGQLVRNVLLRRHTSLILTLFCHLLTEVAHLVCLLEDAISTVINIVQQVRLL